jgi:hypothetical protein
MAITSFDDYIVSAKQLMPIKKTASVTAVAQMITSVFDQAGLPGAGTLGGTNTANGLVPTDATAGAPTINAFTGGAKGYLTRCSSYNSVACTLYLVDILFKAGAYSFNAAQTLSAQPSYSSRVPGGTDFKGTEIWLETVGAFTGSQTIAVTYLDQDGNAGTTGAIATGVAPIARRCLALPLAAGDSGVQRIDTVTSTIATVGTFNVLVVRPLLIMRIPGTGTGFDMDMLRTGMPEIFADSALALYVRSDSTATGLPEVYFEVANK